MSYRHELEQSLAGHEDDEHIPDTKGLRRFIVELGEAPDARGQSGALSARIFQAINALSHADLMQCKLAAYLDTYGPVAEFSLAPEPTESEARQRLKDKKLPKSERARLEHLLDDKSDPELVEYIADPNVGHPEMLLFTQQMIDDPERERVHGAGWWHSLKKAARKATKVIKHAAKKANRLRKDIGHATDKLRHNAVTRAYSKFLHTGAKVIGTAAKFIPDKRLQAAADIIGVGDAVSNELFNK